MGRPVITARAAATFEPVGRSVATARGFVRDTLQGWGLADIVDDAVVLTSELVTNAVVHAGTAAEVLCLRDEDGVRLRTDLDYRALPGLSRELADKLGAIRPETLGQAQRIEGMTPAALTVLIARGRAKPAARAEM